MGGPPEIWGEEVAENTWFQATRPNQGTFIEVVFKDLWNNSEK